MTGADEGPGMSTAGCPVGANCEACGSPGPRLAVVTARTAAGVLCLTLCRTCSRTPTVPPRMSVAAVDRFVTSHGEHLATAAGERTGTRPDAGRDPAVTLSRERTSTIDPDGGVMHAGGSVTYRAVVAGRWIGWVGDGRDWRGQRYGGRRWWACWREDGDTAARWSTGIDYPTRAAALDALLGAVRAAAAAGGAR